MLQLLTRVVGPENHINLESPRDFAGLKFESRSTPPSSSTYQYLVGCSNANMTAKNSELELTIEDILNVHRRYITKLYVDDRNTDAEIVDLLYGRHHLEVT